VGAVRVAGTITVVGLDGRALGPAAEAALAAADLVVGGERQLAAAPRPPDARAMTLADLKVGLDAVAQCVAAGGRVTVLASGDPGFFGIVRALRARDLDLVVFPAVSSVAAAFARLGLPWDDAVVVSAHGRDLRRAVNVCRARRKVAVLTGPGAGPAELGAALTGTGRTFTVAEDLGGDERLTTCSPEEATRRAWREPNVVLCLDPARAVGDRGWLAGGEPRPPGGWALPEEAFAHRAGLVTKAEVRAAALARLAPQLGELVWDVGAGSGSVAVECARLGAAVTAVDRDPEACALIGRNAATFGVEVQVVTGTAPGVLAGLPGPDAVFVGGGGPAVVAACAARRPDRVVVALAALQRLAPVQDALTGAGYAVDGVLLQASRLAAMPDGMHRLAPINPVLLVTGMLP
jgi:precorrin-6B C5,15-methyltransferase / cobalt-precorrin-6B C5,C15-methyltransferase